MRRNNSRLLSPMGSGTEVGSLNPDVSAASGSGAASGVESVDVDVEMTTLEGDPEQAQEDEPPNPLN